MENQTILFAFGLTLFAGLSTGVGSALAFFGGIAIVDKMVPSFENLHEMHMIEQMDGAFISNDLIKI